MSQDDKKQGPEENTVELSGIELNVLRQSAQHLPKLRRKGLVPNEPVVPALQDASEAPDESTRSIKRDQLKQLIKSGQENAKSSGILKRRGRASRVLDGGVEQALEAPEPEQVPAPRAPAPVDEFDATKAVPRDIVEELRNSVPKLPRRDPSRVLEKPDAPLEEEESLAYELEELERPSSGLDASSIVDELSLGVEISDTLDPSLQSSEELRAFDSPMEDLFGNSTVIDDEVDEAGEVEGSDEAEAVAGVEDVEEAPSPLLDADAPADVSRDAQAAAEPEEVAESAAAPSAPELGDVAAEPAPEGSSRAALVGVLILILLLAVAAIGMRMAGVF